MGIGISIIFLVLSYFIIVLGVVCINQANRIDELENEINILHCVNARQDEQIFKSQVKYLPINKLPYFESNEPEN